MGNEVNPNSEYEKFRIIRLFRKYGYNPVIKTYSIAMYPAKKDCFAYMETVHGKECSCLKDLYCRYEECRFYKSREQRRKEIENERYY